MKTKKYPRSKKPQQCKTCGETKPAEEFYPDKRNLSGLRGRCKECYKSLSYLRTKDRQQCVTCGEVKPTEKFNTQGDKLNGLQSECRKCRKSRQKSREYPRSSGPQRCRVCGETKSPEEFHTNKSNLSGLVGACMACCKVYERARRYDLTHETYLQMLKEQDNKCAICGNSFTGSPYVDHCHTTGKVRGLLCSTCNTGLGGFKDDPTILENAIKYLTRGVEK